LSIIEARELMQRHRETFRRFWQWSTNILNTATFRLELPTIFGWWLDTTEAYAQEREGKARPGCTPRTIQNYLMQASGSEMLRIACIRADERGIRLCAPIHDALLVEGCIEEIDRVVAETEECMRQASRDVLRGFELRTETKIVRWPDRYADKRGQSMWAIVAGLVGIDTPPYGGATPWRSTESPPKL
jgi:DNA polymerase I